MKFHIVGNGESVDDILKGYDITINELKNENKHIRVWNYLIPGTKLKIPVLTESIVEDLNEIEPFIEDYYPKIEIEDNYKQIDDNDQVLIKEEVNDEDIQTSNYEEVSNEIQEEIKEEKITEIIENKGEENIVRDYKQQPILYRYFYPQPYYYRPIIYVIPRRNKI